MKVSIIIPYYKTPELLRENLPFVMEAKKNAKNSIMEIIVVDDGSNDTGPEIIKKEFPGVKLIKHKINRGFSASINTGVRMAKGNLVCLLNSDVVPSNNFLENALPHFENERVFAVSLHEDGYGWAKGFFSDGFNLYEPGPESTFVHQTFWVSGGSGVFRRSVWMELRGMDEKLFSPFYGEDFDLCYRAAKRGFINLWEPQAKVLHKHESTISRLPRNYVDKIKEKNRLIFIWKNLTSHRLFRKHLLAILRRLVRHPGYIKVVLVVLLKLPDILKAREKEMRESTVSDEAIFARFTPTPNS